MRNVKQWIASQRLRCGILAACAAIAAGCNGRISDAGPPGGTGNTGTGNSGTGNTGVVTGTGGAPVVTNPCTGPTDSRLVVAPQRIVRLTLSEVANSIRSMIDATEATAVASQFMTDVDQFRTFPPLNSPREGAFVIADRWTTLDLIAQHVGQYVFTNFATLTGCPATPTDACATTYLNNLAAKAYRRPLAAAEQTSLTTLYNTLKSSTVPGVTPALTVTSTIQEATQGVVYAIFGTPQFLYRSELGGTTQGTSPPGFTLTPYELATQLSFFLTDSPPDQALLDAARTGGLADDAGVLAQVNRILGLQATKDNLTTAMYTYYKLNLLPNAGVDPLLFPQFTLGLRDDMMTEGRRFLNFALWSGNLTDLLLSRTAFVNSDLATIIYKIPVPAGATTANFVQTTLPQDQRAGILTSSGFITSRARTNTGSVVARGLAIKETMLCVPTPPPPDTGATADAIAAARGMLANQTAVEQVAYRAMNAVCTGCHGHFDAYGLVLENYDAIGTWRTVDEKNRPVVTATTLPSELGGGPVANALDLADKLSTNPGWLSCMAKSVLQYALTDVTSAPVDLAGCAVQDVTTRYSAATTKTFTELVRDVATAKTLATRKTPQ